MTEQVSHMVSYADRQYCLAGVNGEGLFEPASLGLEPIGTSTDNWRGFWCSYEVAGGQLELATLHIGLESNARLPVLGVTPRVSERYGPHSRRDLAIPTEMVYEHLHVPVPFTGGLLLGAGFIEDMYVYLGLHPAYEFQVVHELIFAEGRLLRATDQSSVMEKIRESMNGQPLSVTRDAPRVAIEKRFEGTFSLKYR